MNQQPSITCPECDATSYNPNDVREGYCGNCHQYTSHRVNGQRPHECRCRSCHRERKTTANTKPSRDWPRRLRIARNLIALALTLAGGFAAGDAIGDFDDDDDCQPTHYDD